jgi:predicted  nucleic acid-binding Zn-ribbon protein
MTLTRCLIPLAALAVLALSPLHGAAQNAAATPPKIVVPDAPAVKKAAGPKTLGGKAPVGKMLSRDELRSCLKRLDGVNTSTKDLEQRRAALDKEKEDLVKSGDALKAERADVDTKLAAVRDWEGRMRAHGAEVETFNQRLKAADEAPKAKREEMAKEFDAERERLGKARAPLGEEEARVVPAYQNAVKAYNDKAQARDAVVADWNGRNKAINEVSLKHDEERSAWLGECANRPYREDDEIAIKSGK